MVELYVNDRAEVQDPAEGVTRCMSSPTGTGSTWTHGGPQPRYGVSPYLAKVSATSG